MNDQEQQIMETQDMGLAITLVCLAYELIDLQVARSSKRITFRFNAASDIHKTAQDYWNGKLQVDPKLYWNESKNIKTRLYSLY